MAERTFDNRFRHGKCHFELGDTSPLAVGVSGAKFEKVTLDEEVGSEIVLFLTDSTPFAHQLKQEQFELHLKSGAVRTSAGPVLFLLWWMPPVTNGKPFALYEQLLNPAHAGTMVGLGQIARQTHLHLVLIGPDQELLDVYEFENTFGMEKLIPISESACEEYGASMDFFAAKREYDQTTNLMELFGMGEPGAEEETEVESERDSEDEFLIAESSRVLIDSAVWLAGRLLTHPACTREKRAALAKALVGLTRLPRSTPGLTVDFGFSIQQADGDPRYWSVSLDETELMWSAGGYVHGPMGGDSFTSFQLSLLRGSQDTPIGDVGAWLELKQHLKKNIDVTADDASDEDFWERYAPMAAERNPFPSVSLEPDTTFRYRPNTGDYLLCIRCTDPSCHPPTFDIIDFWEFREGDRLLITNREEDYPAAAEQMDEGGPSLWKVVPCDCLAWVGWRGQSNERKPTLVALVNCRQEGYVYGEPASPTLESMMSFGTPTSAATPEIRSLWMVGYDAAVSLGLPLNRRPPE